MWSNTKLLTVLSLLTLILGFGLIWLGVNQFSSHQLATLSVTPLPATVSLASPTASASSAVFGIEGERALVTKVVDGDTIELENGKKVRYVGMDTPETVDPRRPVGCFGKEASNENKKLVGGKIVILQKDVSDTDKYDRLLRYVYLPLENGEILFVNDYLVREGFAKVYTYPPDVKFNQRFLEAEREARAAKRGLWGKC